ncbi:MAG: hypothetical protein ACRD2J_01150 [Thermoanaerobaculia bacterium]
MIAIKRHAESSLVLHRMALRLHLMMCAMTVLTVESICGPR